MFLNKQREEGVASVSVLRAGGDHGQLLPGGGQQAPWNLLSTRAALAPQGPPHPLPGLGVPQSESMRSWPQKGRERAPGRPLCDPLGIW